jgi:flagellar basal-body rod protein FlgC
MSGIFASMDISTSALKAQRARMNVIAGNIANVNTTIDQDGNNIPYRRKQIVFQEAMDGALGNKSLGGVEVASIEDNMSDFSRRYEPGDIHADKDGYILGPNVDVSIEMVNMIEASRSYEANIAAIDIAKSMINNTFEILA